MDAGRYGVGYFQPDNCDNNQTACTFTKYPEFDNLKAQYTTTTASNVTNSTYIPARKAILSCPSTMSIVLPPMPDGSYVPVELCAG